MRITSFLLISSAAITGIAIAAGYAEEASAGVSEVAVFFKPSETTYVSTLEQSDMLAPGMELVDVAGDKIGTIMAISSRDGQAKVIWTYTDTYSAEFVRLENGKAVYTPEQDIALRGGSSSNALPY